MKKKEKLDKEMDNYLFENQALGKEKLDDDIDEYMKAAGKNENASSKNEVISTAAKLKLDTQEQLSSASINLLV